ncbi:MAG: hypothetical protein M3540_07130 [Actinomycetota bacterium]|nr:hypothetical protein [Actinomycetota bacterium]
MSKPIAIEFSADTKDVIRGAGNIADAFDEVSDALVDVGKASAKSTDKVQDGAKDVDKALDKAGDSADELGRKMKESMSKVSDDARKAGKGIGDGVEKGTREAGESLDEMKGEAASTAKESAASFDGSAESILGSFQEVAANAFAGFGPAGAAAGLAAAVGIGIAVTAMQDTAEKATEAKQKSVDMIDAIKDAGGNLADMDLSEKIIGWGREVMEDNWITFWADESSTRFQETAKDAKEYGVDTRDAIRAASGSLEDSQRFLDATAQSWQDLSREIDNGTTTTEQGLMVMDDSAKSALNQRNALSDLRGQAEDNIKTTKDAVEIYGIEKDALDATKEAAEAATEAIQEKADANSNAASAAMSAQEADLAWIETLGTMSKDIAANGHTIDINTEAGRANRESLLDIASAANSVVEAQVAQGGSTADVTAKAQALRDAFVNQADAAGYTRAEAEALATSYGLVPGNVDTMVQAHGTEEAKAAVESIPAAKNTDVTVTQAGAEEAGAAVSKAAEPKEAEVTVKESGAAAVQQTIDNIKGRDIPITLSIANAGNFANELARLTAPRTAYVDLVARPGVGVAQ